MGEHRSEEQSSLVFPFLLPTSIPPHMFDSRMIHYLFVMVIQRRHRKLQVYSRRRKDPTTTHVPCTRGLIQVTLPLVLFL